jgi:hypothetical protein
MIRNSLATRLRRMKTSPIACTILGRIPSAGSIQERQLSTEHHFDRELQKVFLFLTSRESEMRLSISRGKASREQVFVKLGVENRASAAARAIRALAR